MTGYTDPSAAGSAPAPAGEHAERWNVVDPAGTGPATTVLGPAEQVPIGEGRAFAVDGEQIAVFRLRDGSVRALSAVCTHRSGPIADGTIDQRVVVCPLHQNVFELDTGCSTSGAPPLRSYSVRVDDDGNLVLGSGRVTGP